MAPVPLAPVIAREAPPLHSISLIISTLAARRREPRAVHLLNFISVPVPRLASPFYVLLYSAPLPLISSTATCAQLVFKRHKRRLKLASTWPKSYRIYSGARAETKPSAHNMARAVSPTLTLLPQLASSEHEPTFVFYVACEPIPGVYGLRFGQASEGDAGSPGVRNPTAETAPTPRHPMFSSPNISPALHPQLLHTAWPDSSLPSTPRFLILNAHCLLFTAHCQLPTAQSTVNGRPPNSCAQLYTLLHIHEAMVRRARVEQISRLIVD